MCSKKTHGERIAYLNKLYQAKRDLTHEEIRNILKLMLDFWSEVHQNLVKNYGIPKVSGLTYIAPPEYSSENNSNAGSKSNSMSKSKSNSMSKSKSNSMSKSKSRSRSRQSTSIKKSKKKSVKSTNNSLQNNVDLTQPDWNTKITDKQLIKLQKDILGKVMPVTKVTKKIIIKKIKQTINN